MLVFLLEYFVYGLKVVEDLCLNFFFLFLKGFRNFKLLEGGINIIVLGLYIYLVGKY